MAESDSWPEEGELLICVVSSVKENGAYLNLEGYEGRTGFVFIGEVASGWVKNISAHLREGQRVVAKAIQVRRISNELSCQSSLFLRNAEGIRYKPGRIVKEQAR